MKGNASRATFGLVIILLGSLLILKNTGLIVNFSFDGWWTLFIILPCLASIFSNGFRAHNMFGLLVGLYLLAWEQDWIPSYLMRDYFWAGLLIFFGLWILLSSFGSGKMFHMRSSGGDFSEHPDYVAVFSGNSAKNISTALKSAKVTAVFGGLDADFSEATLSGNVHVEATAVFGGVELIAPKNANIIVKGVPVFGGCSNEVSKPFDPALPTMTIDAAAIFGSVEVK